MEFIEKISSKSNDYLIKRSKCGFCAEVRTRNKLQLLKEYYNDYAGNTHKHPVFLNKFFFDSIDSIKWLIDVHIKIDNNKNGRKQY